MTFSLFVQHLAVLTSVARLFLYGLKPHRFR